MTNEMNGDNMMQIAAMDGLKTTRIRAKVKLMAVSDGLGAN